MLLYVCPSECQSLSRTVSVKSWACSMNVNVVLLALQGLPEDLSMSSTCRVHVNPVCQQVYNTDLIAMPLTFVALTCERNGLRDSAETSAAVTSSSDALSGPGSREGGRPPYIHRRCLSDSVSNSSYQEKTRGRVCRRNEKILTP